VADKQVLELYKYLEVVGVDYKLEVLAEEDFVMVLLNHQLFFYLTQPVH
jgi:hypothetical protein